MNSEHFNSKLQSTHSTLNESDVSFLQWMNPILLRRTQQIMLPLSTTQRMTEIEEETFEKIATYPELLASFLSNIQSLGFTFAPPLLQATNKLSREQLTDLHDQTISVLQKMLGAHVPYRPMYPNFPDEVMDATDAELYLNAVYHYATGDLPEQQARPRVLSLDHTKLKLIRLADRQEGVRILRNLASANGSLSEQDKEDLSAGLRHVPELDQLLPLEIPYKENIAFIASVLLEEGRADIQQLARYFRTATDVLRLAAGLSGLDTSLAWAKKLPMLTRPFQNAYNMNQGMDVQVNREKQIGLSTAYHFRKFKRSERRLLLGLLDRTTDPLEDMLLYREQWKRLGEILHPGEMRVRYPTAFEAFTRLRREKHIKTFRTEIEEGLRSGDPTVIGKLASRPGELARRLDYVLRSQSEHTEMILAGLERGVKQIAVPLLLQVMAHFRHRRELRRYRIFFPKGNMGKVVAVPNRLPMLDQSPAIAVVNIIESELKQRFAKRESLGNVYIDPRLQKIPVPFSQRSASHSLRPLPRGSRIPMPTGDTIRLFCWWKDVQDSSKGSERTDIDLSVILMDKNWNHVETLAYYNLKEAYGVHSGDIVSAPNGASEFIDLNIPAVQGSTLARYAMVQVSCFTGQAFAELPECFAGFMMRHYSQTGEVYDPRTVQSRFDLTVEAQLAAPFTIDLEQREMIWMDAVIKNRSYQINAAENMTGLQMLGHAFADLRKTTLAELFTLHTKARGKLTTDPAKADTIFDMEQGITPYQTDVILNDYL